MKTATLFISMLCCAFAQQDKNTVMTNASPVGQRELMPFNETAPGPDEKVCGLYFVLLMKYPTNPPGILFLYKGSNAKVSLIGAMSKSKFKTIIDNTKKTPTAEMIGNNVVIDRTTKVVVRISKNDFVKASGCLPKP